jgi:hypothetical protein
MIAYKDFLKVNGAVKWLGTELRITIFKFQLFGQESSRKVQGVTDVSRS